jgi:hypothetical protein
MEQFHKLEKMSEIPISQLQTEINELDFIQMVHWLMLCLTLYNGSRSRECSHMTNRQGCQFNQLFFLYISLFKTTSLSYKDCKCFNELRSSLTLILTTS